MNQDNVVLKNEMFYCEHLTLSRDTMRDIDDFRVTLESGVGLMEYLQDYAFHDEERKIQRIYLVRDIITDELVAYFGLRAGLMSTNEHIIVENGEESSVFDTISGVELAEFAINEVYSSKHPQRKGCGLIIFHDFIMPIVRKVSSLVGCEILYGYSVDKDGKLLERYINDYHFKRLKPESEKKLHHRLKPRFDAGCIFIYQRI